MRVERGGNPLPGVHEGGPGGGKADRPVLVLAAGNQHREGDRLWGLLLADDAVGQGGSALHHGGRETARRRKETLKKKDKSRGFG